MTRSVFVVEAARREFEAAVEWYEARRAGLGLEFVAEVDRVVGSMADNPGMFVEVRRGIRGARVRRFPYRIYFRAEPRGIVVIAIFHAGRDPAVWLARV